MARVLQNLISRLESLNGDKIARETFDLLTEDIEELNREQLRKGERVDGSKLPNYAPSSFPKTGPIKLRDTGSFYRGITAETAPTALTIEGQDSKSAKLIARYGDVIGLSEESIAKLQALARPILIQKVRNVFQ